MQLKPLSVRREKGQGGRVPPALMRPFLSVVQVAATSVADHSCT